MSPCECGGVGSGCQCESEHTAENDAPVCRSCYAATLTPDQRQRFYDEPVTSCVYFCDDHQRAMDAVLNSLPQIQLIKASMSAFEPPQFALVDDEPTSVTPPGSSD